MAASTRLGKTGCQAPRARRSVPNFIFHATPEAVMLGKLLGNHAVIFTLGALSVGAVRAFTVGLGAVARPVVKGTIKSGIVLGRQVQTFTQQVKEDLEDLGAEAVVELATDEMAAAEAAAAATAPVASTSSTRSKAKKRPARAKTK